MTQQFPEGSDCPCGRLQGENHKPDCRLRSPDGAHAKAADPMDILELESRVKELEYTTECLWDRIYQLESDVGR